jgi:hypothetical protein
MGRALQVEHDWVCIFKYFVMKLPRLRDIFSLIPIYSENGQLVSHKKTHVADFKVALRV